MLLSSAPPAAAGTVGRVEFGARDVRRARDVDQICRPAWSRRASVALFEEREDRTRKTGYALVL